MKDTNMIDWFILVDHLEPKLAKKIHWFENEREAIKMARNLPAFYLLSGTNVVKFLKNR